MTVDASSKQRVADSRRPARTQRERVAESTRRLLPAAVELFAEQGYDRTTAAQIGERAGYSRAMVRRRYGSKEGLLQVLFDIELRQRVTPPVDPDRTGLGQILLQVDQFIAFVESDEMVARAFFVLAFETGAQRLALRAAFREWFADYEANMKQSLRVGKRDKTIRQDLDIDHEAQQFVSQCLGLAFRWTLDWEGYDFLADARAWRAALAERYRP
ncbi:TetR/AcrR family transcriptional regulator [Mycobacterium sp.]|uniref:TetR/AcrR family transcriptional regulator n=1 Tax=Mycobacterium sp. TaxID=1785 RepID=UPI0011FD86DD|nr:TetR/AcrR family transcriptional regulator [Mycobacterium sp.]TAM69790.1 MAG: TetR/AcrR family transcriptional regulator [Mycobacterium sp.]